MDVNSPNIRIRRAGLADLDMLIQFRVAFFHEIRNFHDDQASFKNALQQYFTTTLPSEEFIAYVAEINGKIVASSGLVFLQKPPSPSNLTGKEAYIMNMYTIPEWRNKGIGTKLLKEIIRQVQKKGISAIRLHAEPDAIRLYEKNGFVFSEPVEMILKLAE